MASVTLDMLKDKLVGVQTYNNYFVACCPFHDDTKPSLMVYSDGWFKCLACGVTGNWERLYRKLVGWDASKIIKEKTSWKSPRIPSDLDSLRVIADEAHESLLKFEQFQWYLHLRGIEGRIMPCRLGWMEGWYTVPIYDRTHQLQGLVLRANATIQRATGQRFMQPRGQKPMMYCPDWHLYDTGKSLAVVFGMFDALAVSDLRYPVVTPIMGKDSFDPAWLDDCRKKIVIIPDKGEEGTAHKLAAALGWRGEVLKVDYPEDIKDPDGFLETGRREQLNAILASALGEL